MCFTTQVTPWPPLTSCTTPGPSCLPDPPAASRQHSSNILMTAALKDFAKSVIWAPSEVSVSAFSPSIAHTFLFFSMSHSFLLEARHLERMLQQLWVLISPPHGTNVVCLVAHLFTE